MNDKKIEWGERWVIEKLTTSDKILREGLGGGPNAEVIVDKINEMIDYLNRFEIVK